MTWLFDAKYRIDGKEKGVDVPPEDAINQMHRYRDAIYFKDYADREALKKEVIGGYILFPGDGEKSDIQVSDTVATLSRRIWKCLGIRPTAVAFPNLLCTPQIKASLVFTSVNRQRIGSSVNNETEVVFVKNQRHNTVASVLYR